MGYYEDSLMQLRGFMKWNHSKMSNIRWKPKIRHPNRSFIRILSYINYKTPHIFIIAPHIFITAHDYTLRMVLKSLTQILKAHGILGRFVNAI